MYNIIVRMIEQLFNHRLQFWLEWSARGARPEHGGGRARRGAPRLGRSLGGAPRGSASVRWWCGAARCHCRAGLVWAGLTRHGARNVECIEWNGMNRGTA